MKKCRQNKATNIYHVQSTVIHLGTVMSAHISWKNWSNIMAVQSIDVKTKCFFRIYNYKMWNLCTVGVNTSTACTKCPAKHYLTNTLYKTEKLSAKSSNHLLQVILPHNGQIPFCNLDCDHLVRKQVLGRKKSDFSAQNQVAKQLHTAVCMAHALTAGSADPLSQVTCRAACAASVLFPTLHYGLVGFRSFWT